MGRERRSLVLFVLFKSKSSLMPSKFGQALTRAHESGRGRRRPSHRLECSINFYAIIMILKKYWFTKSLLFVYLHMNAWLRDRSLCIEPERLFETTTA